MSIPKRFHKPSRLEDFDYSSIRSYFLTIVTRKRECILGSIEDGSIKLTVEGAICNRWWEWLAEQYDYVKLEDYVIMPNHIHGIIRFTSLNALEPTVQLSIGRIISAFKTKSTAEVNRLRNSPGIKFWQDDFHDRIIRNEEERNRIAEYIRLNPQRWAEDSENPNTTNIDGNKM